MKQEKKNKSENPIYLITAMCILNGNQKRFLNTTRSQRTFGYGCSLKEAKSYVKQNKSDIYECLYNYVVIEKMCSGIHARVIKEYWYKWDLAGKKYKSRDKASCLIGIVNFGIG